MRVLVFGRSGQVATELARLEQRGTPDVGPTELAFLSRAEADLRDPAACAAAITGWAPDAVINAAAFTAVDAAETAEAEATVINGAAPTAMAEACAAAAIPFVQISTDYVFDGSGTAPWRPDDATGPLGAYGRSKLAGEAGVAAAGGTHAILRTSWVFSGHGANFVKTMLRLGAERAALNVVGDQIGGPTPAAAIAQACVTIAHRLAEDPGRSGVYHFAGAPDVSWAGFAREIMEQAGLECAVTDIPTAAYPTPAARPANSRLDCQSLQTAFAIPRPDWRAGLADVLDDLKGNAP